MINEDGNDPLIIFMSLWGFYACLDLTNLSLNQFTKWSTAVDNRAVNVLSVWTMKVRISYQTRGAKQNTMPSLTEMDCRRIRYQDHVTRIFNSPSGLLQCVRSLCSNRGPGCGRGGDGLPAGWPGVEHQQCERLGGRARQPAQQLQRRGLLQRQPAAPAGLSGEGQAARLQPIEGTAGHWPNSTPPPSPFPKLPHRSQISLRPHHLPSLPRSLHTCQDWPSLRPRVQQDLCGLSVPPTTSIQHLQDTRPQSSPSSAVRLEGLTQSTRHQSNEWDFKDAPRPPSIHQKHNFQPENVPTQ